MFEAQQRHLVALVCSKICPFGQYTRGDFKELDRHLWTPAVLLCGTGGGPAGWLACVSTICMAASLHTQCIEKYKYNKYRHTVSTNY